MGILPITVAGAPSIDVSDEVGGIAVTTLQEQPEGMSIDDAAAIIRCGIEIPASVKKMFGAKTTSVVEEKITPIDPGIFETPDAVLEARAGDIEDKHAESPINKDCGDTLENMLVEAKRKRQGSAKPPSKRMKKTLFSKTPPDVRSGGEIPCLDVEIERHAKDAGKVPALLGVIDLAMVGAEGPILDTIVDASLNSEVPIHCVSIDGTVLALDTVVDASLNNEDLAHHVSVDGSLDGSVRAP
ncbi:hypothetical protein L7F22_018270 [Adiantum nelumboides]|nr:hypothetical protein [Adiantum nelumboides]